MPEMVQSVALSWIVFTGSADDESVGQPGLYHWFEHVPFRGTKKFPGGYEATRGWATRHNGHIGAVTHTLFTRYDAFLPIKMWRKGLEVITDLVGQPLIRDEDVTAEREIINQEMSSAWSELDRTSFWKLRKAFYPNHPFANPILGNEATLANMDASTLRQAWKVGYDRSRLALICVGNISIDQLLQELKSLEPILPDHGLSERRQPTSSESLPEWRHGKFTTEKIGFTSSVVCVAFPIPGSSQLERFFNGSLLEDLFSNGDMASPLYKTVREKYNLAYKASCEIEFFPSIGHFGLYVETRKNQIPAVIDALDEVIADPVVRSKARLEEVREGVSNLFKMRAIDPNQFKRTFAYRYMSTGQVINDSEYEYSTGKYSLDQIINLLDQLTSENAHTVVLGGTT